MLLNDNMKPLRISAALALFLPLLSACQTAKMSTALDQFARGEYYEASLTLKRVYRRLDPREQRQEKGEAAWYMGQTFDKLMIPAQAAAAYQNALRYDYDDPQLLLLLARARHHEGRYREAERAYEEYLTTIDPADPLALAGIEGARKAAEWKEAGSRYEIRRFPLINSRRAEFSPAIYGAEDEILYYTTSNDKTAGDGVSPITGTRYCDIWMIQKDEKGNWKKPESAGACNTAMDEGTPCFSPDGATMYYTAAGGGEGMPEAPQIFYASRSDATWSKGQLLNMMGDTLSTFAHPAVSPDGRWLYFVSDQEGGLGGLDLWRAPLESAGSVGFAENLGAAINTKGNEMFPTFSPDGILYFSSDGREGMGGLDLYSARLDEWGTWHVEHLGAPMNSAGDDFGMTFRRATREQQEGWFSSNRNQGKGYDNIYAFLLPSIKVRITGAVYDTEENPVAEAVVRVVGRNGMNFKSLTRPDGTYEVSIDRSTQYVMMAGKTGYLNRKAEFASDQEEEDADYEVDFFLPNVMVPQLIDNIFYDYNMATLREESYPALDDLVSLLKDNPYCAIELSAHTDRVGSQSFNLDLSQRRAESVVNYLISQGIEPERLTPVGYGKEMPVIVDEALAQKFDFFPVGQTLDEDFVTTLPDDQREEADQINRRTEFKVLTTTFGLR